MASHDDPSVMPPASASEAASRTGTSSEELLRLVFENARDFAIFTQDMQGCVTSWNPGAQALFGYTEAEMLGQSVDILFTPEDRERKAPEEEVRQALELGRGEDERWHMRKDGSRFFASGVLRPLQSEASDEPHGFVKILRDLTERKLHEQALLQAKNVLEQRVQERTRKVEEANLKLRSEAAERKRLLQRVVTVQEDERARISRELHDQLSQSLAVIKLWLHTLPDFPDPGVTGVSANSAITLLEKQVATMMDQAHRLAWELRPPALATIGLKAALEQYAGEWSKNSGLSINIACNAKLPKHLPPEIETTLYRVAQEGLTNVNRHAEASEVSIVLSVMSQGKGKRKHEQVSLIISDNGRGFDVEQATSRLGLLGMSERLELVGGSLEVESSVGQGTSLYARVPLQRRESPRD